MRRPDKAQQTPAQIVQALARGIRYRTARINIECVDREIPPHGILGQACAKGYGRAAAMGFDITAKAGHFITFP